MPGDQRAQLGMHNFLSEADGALDAETRASARIIQGTHPEDALGYGSFYTGGENPIRPVLSDESGQSRKWNVPVIVNGAQIVPGKVASGDDAGQEEVSSGAKGYAKATLPKPRDPVLVGVTHSRIVNIIDEDDRETALRRYTNTEHTRIGKGRDLEKLRYAVRLILSSGVRGEPRYFLRRSEERAKGSGVVIGHQSIVPEVDDMGQRILRISAILSIKASKPDHWEDNRYPQIGEYVVVAPAVCDVTEAQLADPEYTLTYDLGHPSLGMARVITSMDNKPGSALLYSGQAHPRLFEMPKDPKTAEAIRRKMFVHGINVYDYVDDGEEMRRRIIDGLYTHNPWTGHPNVRMTISEGGLDTPVKNGHLALCPEIELIAGKATMDSYCNINVHAVYNRLRCTAIEYNDIREAIRTPRHHAAINAMAEDFYSTMAYNMCALESGWQGKRLSLAHRDAFTAFAKKYFKRQLRNSFIYVNHREVVGSDFGGTTSDEFAMIQAARMYLSLHYARMKGGYTSSILPRRFLAAASVPLSLTSYGYIMYSATPNILSFFKELLWGESGRLYFGTGTLADLKSAFEQNQHEQYVRSITHTAISTITRSPLRVDPTLMADEDSKVSHAIETGDGEFMNLEPIMWQAFEDLSPGTAGFIYDSRFVMLVYRTSGTDPNDRSVVLLNTTTRSSRIVKHSKNISHTTVTLGGYDLQMGTDQAVGGGYMLPFISMMPAIKPKSSA
jgi:hypothetical protein